MSSASEEEKLLSAVLDKLGTIAEDLNLIKLHLNQLYEINTAFNQSLELSNNINQQKFDAVHARLEKGKKVPPPGIEDLVDKLLLITKRLDDKLVDAIGSDNVDVGDTTRLP